MKKIRRLYFDIETSPNIGFFWRPGTKVPIDHQNIIQERAIICVCYKWSDQKKVHSIIWDKEQNDKNILRQFVPIMSQADEIVAHNGDRFDIKWLRTRCLKHGITMPPSYISIDTLKVARSNFTFNSNRLDYIAKFLEFGGKKPTGFDLWKKIVLENNATAMRKMVDYCKHDVILLEKVWDKINPYVKSRTAVSTNRTNCPECDSTHRIIRGSYLTVAGNKKVQLQCKDCGKYEVVPQSVINRG